MLEMQNLAARRGGALLFSGLDLSLPPGAALIVSGPNGSGKTTLLRILAGMTQPAEGTLRWRGREIRAFDAALRAEMLFIGHAPALKDELTALENLKSLTELHGVAATLDSLRRALDAWALTRRHALPARVLSQGQRRRIGLARLALLARPLWLLDEPSAALDDAGVATLTAVIAGHLARGGSAVIATHQELSLPAHATRSLSLT